MNSSFRARCRTFPLDQLLEARRRRVMICLNCGDSEEPAPLPRWPWWPGLRGLNCINCGSLWLMLAEDIIIINFGANSNSLSRKGFSQISEAKRGSWAPGTTRAQQHLRRDTS